MKSKIGFVVDNTSIFKPNDFEKLNVGAMFELKALTDEDKNYTEFASVNDFYKYLYDNNQFGKTSTASLGDINDAINKALEKFEHVIVIPTSSKISSTYANVCVSVKNLNNDNVKVIDSLSVVGASRYLVEKGNELIEQNLSFEQICENLQSFAKKCCTYILISNFDALVKNGRIGKAKSHIASLLNIKALVAINENGVEIINKFRSTKKAFKTITEELKQDSDQNFDIYLGDIFNKTDISEFKQILDEQDIKYKHLVIPPIIGLHGGNKLIGLTFVKK